MASGFREHFDRMIKEITPLFATQRVDSAGHTIVCHGGSSMKH